MALKQKLSRSWRDTIKPDPYVIQGLNGKDFVWSENENKISLLIRKYVESIKQDLFEKLKSAFEPEFKKLIPKNGEQGLQGSQGLRGEKGDSGSQFYFFDIELDDSVGSDGDISILKQTGRLYKKIEGVWKFQTSLRATQPNIMAAGGVSEQYVMDYVAANLQPNVLNIEEKTSDFTTGDEDIVIAKGAAITAITLKAPSSATKPIIIKNRSDNQLTISVSGGSNIDDDTEFIMSLNTSFSFVPQGGQYYVY